MMKEEKCYIESIYKRLLCTNNMALLYILEEKVLFFDEKKRGKKGEKKLRETN